MKILILANNDVGLFKFRRELIQELLKEHEVFISLPYGKMVEPLVADGCTFIETSIDRRGINPIKDFKLILDYSKTITDCSPDLIVTYTIKPNIYGGIVSRIKNVTYAANITGLGTAFEKEGILKRFVVSLYKLALKQAKVVFFENSDNRKVFLENGIIQETQSELLNGAGVNLDYYYYQQYPENDVFRFLFIGRVMKEKGVEELFYSMKRLTQNRENCCLDIVGFCEEDYTHILKQYENEGWLHYYGFQDDVRPIIKTCDCFVLPSYHEGLANTILESAASGRPIITTNIAGCKEAVVDKITGLLCQKKDYQSLVDAMDKIMSLPRSERIAMGIKGRQLMENTFDRYSVIISTLDAICK